MLPPASSACFSCASIWETLLARDEDEVGVREFRATRDSRNLSRRSIASFGVIVAGLVAASLESLSILEVASDVREVERSKVSFLSLVPLTLDLDLPTLLPCSGSLRDYLSIGRASRTTYASRCDGVSLLPAISLNSLRLFSRPLLESFNAICRH